jgi:hypothetical protein
MTAIAEPADLQLKRIYQIAQEYRANGYRVVVGPSQRELPEFLRGFEPDLIAFREDDNVVIEVKRRKSLIAAKTLSQIAAAVERQPQWRLELVLIASEIQPEEPMPTDVTVERARELLRKAREARDPEFAAVLAWAAAEHAIVIAAQRAGVQLPSTSPSAALKTMFAYGLLTDDDYERLQKAMKVRNEIVHDGRSTADVRASVSAIVPIAEKLAA